MTTIDLKPILDAVEPLVVEALVTLILAGASLLLNRLYAFLGFKFNDAQWKVVHSAALAEAQRYWASVEPSIAAKAVLTVKDPIVAAMAQKAIETIPLEAKKLGITPDTVAELIVAKFGGLQAASPKG